jgi:phosphohistidine phosphatase
MRRLMLMRHAKSDWSVGGQRDHDRALAARGREAAPLIAAYMARHGLRPDRVLVSTARRARETWDLVAPAFGKGFDVSFDARL